MVTNGSGEKSYKYLCVNDAVMANLSLVGEKIYYRENSSSPFTYTGIAKSIEFPHLVLEDDINIFSAGWYENYFIRREVHQRFDK